MPATSCVCAQFVCGVVVPQPIGAHVLNRLTNCSVQFNSLSYVSGKTTSVFNHFKSQCQSKKLKASSWVINLVKKQHTELSGMNISTERFLCIVWSVQSAQHVKCSTCFLGLFCCPWQNVWRWTMCQLEASHEQRKSYRQHTEDFPFYGLWDAVFIAFGCNLSRHSSKFLYSAHCSQQLNIIDIWCMFLWKLHIHHTQNQITTLKIWFSYT